MLNPPSFSILPCVTQRLPAPRCLREPQPGDFQYFGGKELPGNNYCHIFVFWLFLLINVVLGIGMTMVVMMMMMMMIWFDLIFAFICHCSTTEITSVNGHFHLPLLSLMIICHGYNKESSIVIVLQDHGTRPKKTTVKWHRCNTEQLDKDEQTYLPI